LKWTPASSSLDTYDNEGVTSLDTYDNEGVTSLDTYDNEGVKTNVSAQKIK